jgi:hypothetical protein
MKAGADVTPKTDIAIQDAAVVVDDEVDYADEMIRWDLHDLQGDEGAGEPVDPDSIVPTVGAN